MRGFGLTVEELPDDVTRVALRGELDLEHAYLFEEELRLVEERAPAAIVLDLRELAFVDSCGLARLLAVRARALRAKRRLVLVKGSRALQRLFALAAVADLFETVDDVPRAALR
jgi:anti-sigma B factor antagonist